jgi:transcriptional regulator
MYLPKSFSPPDAGALRQFMHAHPFGALVTMTPRGLEANHIPFLFDEEPGPHGTLRGHVARANPIWQDVDASSEALVIFQGPDSFISPSWYPSKRDTATVVPTWNYVVVHARGTIRVIQDASWLRAHVSALTTRHEHDRPEPWAVTDAPADFIEKLIGVIVGIEIPVTQLTGKWKLSQNRSERDRSGVVNGLLSEGTESSSAVAALVRETLEGA